MFFVKSIHVFVFLVFLFYGCGKFEYSPYQTTNGNLPKELNKLNIESLLSGEQNSDDTVTILLTGDSQRFYDELVDLVDKANSIPEIDLLILAGDISDFSLLQEFKWIHQRLEKLHFPYLCVIGNHDLIANGSEIYESIFGKKNFSFVYKNYKFIFHDNNALEYGYNGTVPDISWLANELSDTTAKWFIGVSHVPPFAPDFDKSLEIPYAEVFASNTDFILSVHGHHHNTHDTFYYNNHVRYLITNAVDKKEFLLIKLINGEIIKEIIPY